MFGQVVEERWGSMGQFAASMASRDVASTHAHLQAINHRRKGLMKEEKKNLDEENNSTEKVMAPYFHYIIKAIYFLCEIELHLFQ